MTTTSTSREPGSGWIASVRAGLSAGCVCGLVFGVIDGVAASILTRAHFGVGSFLACVAAAVLQYSLLYALALGAIGAVLHPWLRRRESARRYVFLLALGCTVGLTAELYWRTREYVFYGHSAVSPERLAAAAVTLAVGAGLAFLLARGIVRLPRAMQFVLTFLVCGSWLVGGLYLAAQQGVGAGRGEINDRNRDLPNVVLVVVDALRQDVLGCYGNARVRTPNLDRLAQEGVVFENAFVQAPFTLTSFGSLLTGKYPRRHGLIKQKSTAALPMQATLPWHLKHARRTDGRELQPDDYVTASFHTGTLSERSGLLHGFDLVFEETAGHDLADLSSPWSQFRADLLLWIFKNRVEKRFDSGLVAREACKWIESLHGRRFMTMVHLYSTHTPYDPPANFRDEYCDPHYTGPVHAFYSVQRYAIEAHKYTPTPADVEQIRNLYDAGVSQADALVGDVVRELERSGVRDDTLIIVTADHGESLGEDGLWEHNHMVRRELRVPLLMAWKGKLPAAKRVSALTDEIDVLPTISDLAGLALPPETDALSKIDGTSLLPLVRGEAAKVRDYSFAENGVRLSIQDIERKFDLSRSAILFDAFANVEHQIELERRDPRVAARYVEYASPRALEEKDVFAMRRDEALALARTLHEWSRSMPIRAELVVPSGRDEEELFNQTGYAGVGDADPVPPTPSDDGGKDAKAPPGGGVKAGGLAPRDKDAIAPDRAPSSPAAGPR